MAGEYKFLSFFFFLKVKCRLLQFIRFLSFLFRTFWRHILFPSTHKPEGDGLSFRTIYNGFNEDDWP